MRLFVRFLLLTVVVFLLLVYFVHLVNQAEQSHEDNEADETVRILLMADRPAGVRPSLSGDPSVTVNAAIVLVVSLVSVALLITAIIFVAVTMDPNAGGAAEDDRSTANIAAVHLDFYDSDDSDEKTPLEVALIENDRQQVYSQGFPPRRGLLPDYDDLMAAHLYR